MWDFLLSKYRIGESRSLKLVCEGCVVLSNALWIWRTVGCQQGVVGVLTQRRGICIWSNDAIIWAFEILPCSTDIVWFSIIIITGKVHWVIRIGLSILYIIWLHRLFFADVRILSSHRCTETTSARIYDATTLAVRTLGTSYQLVVNRTAHLTLYIHQLRN